MRQDISSIDPNLAPAVISQKDGYDFFSVRKPPFCLFGLMDCPEGTPFRRVPEDVARETNPGVLKLSTQTSGGRVCFRTDSKRIALSAQMPNLDFMPHMALTGSSGFDLYVRKDGRFLFYRSFVPFVDMTTGYDSQITFKDSQMRDILIHFPLYNDVSDVQIGLDQGAKIQPLDPYLPGPPVVYYGSSITQGGCASRPGTCFQAIISRDLNRDFVNLGFSGSGRAEEPIVRYMATLEMSAFVSDYDHNAPNAEYLLHTHAPMYHAIRDTHPDIPILFVTRPDTDIDVEDCAERRAAIEKTYNEALAAGDKHVGYVDGRLLFGGHGRDDCTVDGVHPNDIGFWRMAECIGAALAKLFENQ